MAAPQAYIIRKRRPADLTRQERAALSRLHAEFVDCPRGHFLRLLAAADTVYLCHDRADGRLCGFEALRTLAFAEGGRRRIVVFTFFADLAPPLRGRGVLLRIGLGRYLRLRLRHPFARLYWVFSAATFPSFLLMARNLRDYWPRPGHATPPEARRLMARTVAELGLEGWDEAAGVLRRHGLLRYREGLLGSDCDSGIDSGTCGDPLLRFYGERNPGQAEGDALLCLFPLHLRNILFAAARWLKFF